MDTLLSYGNMMLVQMGIIEKPELSNRELEQINTLNSISANAKKVLKPAAYIGAAVTPLAATALIYKKMKGNSSSIAPLKPMTPLTPPTPSPLPTPPKPLPTPSPQPAIVETLTKPGYGIGTALAVALIVGTIYIMTRAKAFKPQATIITRTAQTVITTSEERVGDEGPSYKRTTYTVNGVTERVDITNNNNNKTTFFNDNDHGFEVSLETPLSATATSSASESSHASAVGTTTAGAANRPMWAYNHVKNESEFITQEAVYRALGLSGDNPDGYSAALALQIFGDRTRTEDLFDGSKCMINFNADGTVRVVNPETDII